MGYSVPKVKNVHFDDFITKLPSQEGRVVVITGTTSGTGYVAAKTVAQLGADKVLLLNRKSERASASLQRLEEEVPAGNFVSIECDLQHSSSVRKAVDLVKQETDRINVLALNAGIMAMRDMPASEEEAYDIQMQVNVLSHFRLARDLFPLLEAAADGEHGARIVSHTSIARLGSSLDANYLGPNGGDLGGDGASMICGGARWERYHQTKLANAVFHAALTERLAARNSKIMSVLAHPGLASTNLQATTVSDGGMGSCFTGQFMKFSQSQEDGAIGLIRGMCGAKVESGDFYGPKAFFPIMAMSGMAVKLKLEKLATNKKAKATLWEGCEAAVGKWDL